MSLKDKMDQITDLMKNTKESWVATRPENPDLAIYLHFWRGDDLAVMLQTPLDRDTALEVGHVGAAGFAATAMSITFESYHSTERISPNTGEPWKPHEMQYTVEAVPENKEKHWVLECLSTSAHERGGEYCFSSLPYWIEDFQVRWGEEQAIYSTSNTEGESAQGYMFDYLQNAMSQPTLEEVMAEKAKTEPVYEMMSGLVPEPERRLFHTDMATFHSLEERKLVTTGMFAAEPGSLREELIKERFGDRAIQMGGE